MSTREEKIKYIKKTPVRKYGQEFIYNKFKLKRIINEHRAFIFHSLTSNDLYIIRSLPKDAKIVWLGWGYDYYDLIGKELLKPLTKSIKHVAPRAPFQRIKSFIKRKLLAPPEKRSVINRVHYFSPVLYEEYLLVQRAISGFRPRYVSWNYGTLEDDLIQDFEELFVDGENILLGNSASMTNNHLDAFDILKTMNLQGRKIITPLSYGEPRYRDIVIKRGESMFGGQFVPVVEFMPIDSYIRVISSCSTVIMNHLRQQAAGSIIIMMYLGAKVFLDPENPLYSFFQKQGAWIYTLDQLRYETGGRLTPDQIEQNRSILRKNWGREVITKKAKDLMALLEDT